MEHSDTQITRNILMYSWRENMDAFHSELHLLPPPQITCLPLFLSFSPPSSTAVQEISHPPSTAVAMATKRGKSILFITTPFSLSFLLSAWIWSSCVHMSVCRFINLKRLCWNSGCFWFLNDFSKFLPFPLFLIFISSSHLWASVRVCGRSFQPIVWEY